MINSPVTLDDGQVIRGKLGYLSQREIISLANQLYRDNRPEDARKLMQYQHKKFIKPQSWPPEAA